MKTLLRLLALAVALWCAAPVEAACTNYYNGSCVWWVPELPPNVGARWCAAGERPDSRSVMFWTGWPYYCMVLPVRFHKIGGTKIPNLNQYGWDGPTFRIDAMEWGQEVYGYTYDDYNYTGNKTFWQWPNAGTHPTVEISSFELAY